MQSLFIEKQIAYDGRQLSSHWIFNQTGLKGDSIVSFIGPADVSLTYMVDLEDVAAKKPIFSESMLHFLAEHFESDLEKMILRQRIFISLIQEEFHACLPSAKIVRKGDDLFLGARVAPSTGKASGASPSTPFGLGEDIDPYYFKLTVSIATASPVSVLMHTGVNISSRNTPVLTQGLEDFGLNPQAFARSVMNRYSAEMEGVRWARCKVRGVK